MNPTIILDTYDYAEALKGAGVAEEIIKVEVSRDKERIKVINDIIDNNLATKKDIEDLRLATKRDIEIIKRDMIIWLGTLIGAIITFGPIISKYLTDLMH